MKRLDQIISIASLTAAAAAAFATTNAAAQTYPARQILMVVPLQAGTAVDNVARTLAQGLGVMVPQHQAGKIRLLATTGTTRSPLTPDVPTVREAAGASAGVGTGGPAPPVAPAARWPALNSPLGSR